MTQMDLPIMSSREPGSRQESFGKLRSATPVRGLLAVAAACLLIGCRALETPTDLAATLSQHDASHVQPFDASGRKSALLPEPTPPAELTEDGWAAGSLARKTASRPRSIGNTRASPSFSRYRPRISPISRSSSKGKTPSP